MRSQASIAASIRALRARLRSPVAQFTLAGIAAVAVVGAISAYLFDRALTDEAIRDAEQVTALAGEGIVEPAVTERLIAGDPRAVRRMDAIVEQRILDRDGIIRVKIWDPSARIVYSDEPRLIGDSYELGEDELAILSEDGTEAEKTDLSRPENRFERGAGELLEVYLPIDAAGGGVLLFETYIRSSFVTSSGRRVWSTLAPVLIGTLLVLGALQLPLAASLARRLRRGQEEREALLRRAIDASEMERQRIARDLHDGVVQDLAGVSYSVAAAADRSPPVAGADRDLLRRVAASLRQSVRDLRGLLVEIYPPDLHRAGLGAALSDVVAGLDARGIEATLTVSDDGALPEHVETLFFRAAQEALRNVVAHADAGRADVRIQVEDALATLEVTDDGKGFSPDRDAPESGHFGLRMLTDLVRDAGGTLEVESAPDRGTRVRVEVPVT
jgi:two-component system, NarL family, sensor kinase